MHSFAYEETAHMSAWSGSYNKRLSIAATGVDHQTPGERHGYERMCGSSCVKIQGRTYHTLPPRASTHGCPGGLSFLIFDAHEPSAEEMHGYPSGKDGVRWAILKALRDELCDFNEYARELSMIGQTSRQAAAADNIQTYIPILNTKTSIFEVGAIMSDRSTGQLTVEFKLKNKIQHLNGMNKYTEPLTYPLLFPFGETGWSPEIKNEVSVMKYLAARILMPEQHQDMYQTEEEIEAEMSVLGHRRPMTMMNAKGTRAIPTNRFQIFGRVKQYYLVESLSRVIDNRLNWIRRNQDRFKTSGRQDGAEHNGEDNENENEDESIFLSDSFTGSPRHLQKLALNAIHVVSNLGKPTVFITVTCNPEWNEIKERLFKGQTAFDREDITCQVRFSSVFPIVND